MEITRQVMALKDELIELRRDFHRHPELGFEEHRTSQIVSAYLQETGLQVQHMTRTGVVGLLAGGQPGRTLMLRADMDALPIQEETEVPYKSIYDGKMHACGHDGHTAMLMVAAKILSRYREELQGNIKFVFEPNEENVAALDMIEEGVLEDPKVDACLGIHLWSPLQSGTLAVTPGPVMAGMDHFELTVKGRGGHTSSPHISVDPILAAAAVVQAVQVIQTREINVLQPTVIMFGSIAGGTAANIIPEQVTLTGTLRYLHDLSQSREESLRQRFERIIADTCRMHRAEYELTFLSAQPALFNHPALTELVRSAARSMLAARCDAHVPAGEIESRIVSYVSMAGDDFSEFAARAPGVLYFLGCCKPQWQSPFPHHHPRFDLDEEALPLGVEMHVRTALQYLQQP